LTHQEEESKFLFMIIQKRTDSLNNLSFIYNHKLVTTVFYLTKQESYKKNPAKKTTRKNLFLLFKDKKQEKQ